MLAEEKKDYWEGFSREYIRCYSDKNLTDGYIYNIKFTEVYKNGLKIEIVGFENSLSKSLFEKMNN